MGATVPAAMTSSIRLYVDAPLHDGAEPDATPAQAHYLASVMRRGVGDELRLFNGIDGEWLARIDALRRDRASFVVQRRMRPQAAEPDLWLLFAPLKRDATDLVVQKATELGVAAILPVFTERTNAARLNETRLAAIATEAAEQCERLTVPRIEAPRRLAELLADWPAERRLVVAMERDRCRRRSVPNAGPAALLIGPEGGFTPVELDALQPASLCSAGHARLAHPAGRDGCHRRAGPVAGAGRRLRRARALRTAFPPFASRPAAAPEQNGMLMSNPGDADATPIASTRLLAEYIAAGCKPADQFAIGTEHEKFGFRLTDFTPPPYEPDGIHAVLEGIAATGWTRILDHGRPIGLSRGRASISLEPAGQLELSGGTLATLHDTRAEFLAHFADVHRAADGLGLGFAPLGFHPTASRDAMPWMPKGRYAIMRRYMPKVGSMGLDMMTRTCTVQVNLDYASEADMVRKLRVALALQPVATALFANSPFTEGKPNGFLCYRAHVWTDTDNQRSGIPPVFFEDGFRLRTLCRVAGRIGADVFRHARRRLYRPRRPIVPPLLEGRLDHPDADRSARPRSAISPTI